MPGNAPLFSLLSSVPSQARRELLSFLAFSERDGFFRNEDVTSELLTTLTYFNASHLKPN